MAGGLALPLAALVLNAFLSVSDVQERQRAPEPREAVRAQEQPRVQNAGCAEGIDCASNCSCAKRIQAPAQPLAGQVLAVRTARDTGERLARLPALRLERHAPKAGEPSVVLEPGVRYQTFLGFGGSFTESSAELLLKMGAANQERIISAYFGAAGDGHWLGYRFGRLHIGACDFSLGGWSCAETPGDVELRNFSVQRYRRAILPMVRRAAAAAGRNLSLIASPWSPPAWMKDTGRMKSGGKLLPEFRSAWARHYVRFAREMAAAGAPLWGLTVQNEPLAKTPWENCLYTAEEERDFVRDHLGPTLEDSGLGLKLLIWDHNRDDLFARAHAVYSDPAAAKYVWGAGYHWYGDPRYEWWPDKSGMLCFDNLRLTHELRPDKHIVMTEACQEMGARIGDWRLGERYAEAIIRDLNNWLEAWVDWNLILDVTGGPNHVGNLVSAPVIAEPAKDHVLFLSSYYYLAHFSRHIQPGAQRILAGSSRDALEVTAFANPDGSLVAVVLNQRDWQIDFWLQHAGAAVRTSAPAHSITTFTLPGAAAPPGPGAAAA